MLNIPSIGTRATSSWSGCEDQHPNAVRASQHSEWKESRCDDHLCWACGFANAGKGLLVIRRNDRHRFDGIPHWRWTNSDLWLEFPFSPEYLQAMGGHSRRDDGTDPVADPVADPVDRLLAVLATGPQAPSFVQTALALKHRPTFRANYLRPALNLGLVEMTLPDKPASRLQRYRLTDAGRVRLRALAPRGKPP